jgi:zinc transport system permease protein
MIEFLSYPFFQRSLIAGLIVAILCGALSFFVLLRRLALVASGVAHAAFGGVTLAVLFGLPPMAGGVAAALAVAGATSRSSRAGKGVTEDTAVGVFTVAAMAAGVVALGLIRSNVDLFGLMFGNILTVAWSDLYVLAIVAIGVLGAGLWNFRPLLFASIDEDGAQAAGVDIHRMRLLVLSLLGLTVVAALKVAGILLVSALLVLPGAAARPLAARWPGFLAASIGFSVVMMLGGLLLSVALNIPPGASIILLGTLLFVLSVAIERLRSRSS